MEKFAKLKELIAGVEADADKFMSEARAITNIIGNGVATIVIAKTENEFHPGPDNIMALKK